MTSRDFCFWLQGHFELAKPITIDATTTELIKRHLNLVFKHEIDPSMPDPTGELQAIHDGATLPKPPASLSFLDDNIVLRC
jgi:hypothetical protein